MQTQDQREATRGNSQTTSVLVEEDKSFENQLKREVETPSTETKENEEPQEQMQALITQMKELQEKLQQSEDKVKDFQQKMENNTNANFPSTKEFIGTKANEAKEFISNRSKEASALGLIIATACDHACRAAYRTICHYKKFLMSFMAMIFVGFLVKHEVKQSNEIHSLTQSVQQLQYGLIHHVSQVENLNQNMIFSNLQINSLQNQNQAQQHASVDSYAKTDQNFLDFLNAQKIAEYDYDSMIDQAHQQQNQWQAQINAQFEAQKQARVVEVAAAANAQAQKQVANRKQCEIDKLKVQKKENRKINSQGQYLKRVEKIMNDFLNF